MRENEIFDSFVQELETIDESRLLKVYELHSNYSNNLTSIRNQKIAFYMAINAAVFGFCLNNSAFWSLVLSCIGIVIAFGFYMQLESLRILNSAKIDLLIKIEKKLGLSFYDSEWKLCGARKYKTITYGSKFVVWAFGAVYSLNVVIYVYGLLCQHNVFSWLCNLNKSF